MGLGGDPPRHWMRPIDGERSGRPHLGGRRVRMGEHEARQPIRQGRFADALLTDEQEGMRHATAAVGGKKALLGRRMAEQHVRRPGMGGFVLLRRLRAHGGRLQDLPGLGPA